MKDSIKMFVIGFLVGLIVATGAFLIYTAISSKNQMPGDIPSVSNGEFAQPPGRPNGEPPEMPNGSNNSELNSY